MRLGPTCRQRSKWLVVREFNKAVRTCFRDICSSFSRASRHSAGCRSVQFTHVQATLSGRLDRISYISSRKTKPTMKRCFVEWEKGKQENYSTKLNIKLYITNSIKTLISPRNSHILTSKGTLLRQSRIWLLENQQVIVPGKDSKKIYQKDMFKINEHELDIMLFILKTKKKTNIFLKLQITKLLQILHLLYFGSC